MMKQGTFIFPVGSQLSKLAQLLRPYFLPTSLGTPPLAKGGSGNRTTVLTTADPYAATVNGQQGSVTVSQQGTATLAAGTLTWTYPKPYKNVPIVSAIPVGAPSGTPAGLYISSVSAVSVTVNSELATDTRVVHLTAMANPN